MSEKKATFTWHGPDGKQYDVEPLYAVDEWTGREMRAVDRMSRGDYAGLGPTSKAGIIYALSAARAVPGLTIEAADEQLTVGRIRAIDTELNARYAEIEAAKAAEPEAEGVLSPTRPGEPDGQPQE